MHCDTVMLSWDDSYINTMTYKLNKLGKTKLVFGLCSEFNNKSAHEGLHIPTCSRYDLCPPWLTHRLTAFDQL